MVDNVTFTELCIFQTKWPTEYMIWEWIEHKAQGYVESNKQHIDFKHFKTPDAAK